jgi:hypothetical protein
MTFLRERRRRELCTVGGLAHDRPGVARPNDTLTVVASSTDADGDTVDYDYQWIKNASDLTGETASTLDLSVFGNGDKGDQISVRLTPGDGSDDGLPRSPRIR